MALSGDAAGAIPVGQAGLMVDRSFAPLYAAVSDAYRRIDRYDVAIQNAERAVELDPLDPNSRRIYSYALTWVGQFDEAIDQLEQAIALNPNLAGPYFELAGLYRYQAQQAQDTQFALERYADSVALYEQILAIQPENARAYLRLCEAYFEASENVRATDYCLEAVRLNPDYMEAWASLGQTQYSRRNFEGAIESFERCVELGGEQADLRCYYLRGLAHYYLGGNDCDDAWDVLTYSLNRIRAENPDPNNAVLLNTELGLRLVIDNCSAYRNAAFPTGIPPTAVPPTPIGS
jgi:tetratricopeptide (TPR) repeat protein